MVIFIHIPKCAGTSFTKGVLSKGSKSYYDARSKRRILIDFLLNPVASNNWIVGGHHPYGLHLYTPYACDYITILRTPIARAISHYHYIQMLESANYTHPENHLFTKHSIYEILDSSRSERPISRKLHPNLQARYIAGVNNNTPDKNLNYLKILKAAKENLLAMPFFGLVEFYHESINLYRNFSKTSGIQIKFEKPSGAPSLSDNDQASLEKFHELDFELYSFAKRIFEKRLSGAKFDE